MIFWFRSKNLVGLNQQGVNIGEEGQKAINEQAKALGISLPKLEEAKTIGGFSGSVESIDSTVKSILQAITGQPVPGANTTTTTSGDATGSRTFSLDKVPGVKLTSKENSLLGALMESGYSISDLKEPTKEEVGEHPRGYRSELGEDYRDVRGQFHPQDNKIDIFDQVRGRKIGAKEKLEILLHEAGHALDKASGYTSESKEFSDAYAEDAKGLSAEDKKKYQYFLQEGNAGKSETFAELNKSLFEGDGDYPGFSKSFKNSSEVLKKLLDKKNFGISKNPRQAMKDVKELLGASAEPAKPADFFSGLFSDHPLFEELIDTPKEVGTYGQLDTPYAIAGVPGALSTSNDVFSDSYGVRNGVGPEAFQAGLLNKASKNAKGAAGASDIFGGFLDSNIDNIKDTNRTGGNSIGTAKSTLLKGGIAVEGGKNYRPFNPDEGSGGVDIGAVVEAINNVSAKLEQTIRKGVEGSFN